MNAQEHIGKLQGLLARIQRNAAKARTGATAAAPIALAAPPLPPPAPSPPAPPISAADQSVDDLLGGSPQHAQDIDVLLESVAPPPPVEVAPAPSEAPEAEPIPLVSVATPAAEPPIDDPFSLESEVSEVRIATISREPAPDVTVAAIEAEAEPIAAEELSEDDLVEVTEGTPLPAETSSDVDIDFGDEDEQPPASSKRSKVATTMDEALAAAAAQLDVEREVPLKTPPPESGPQEAPLPTGLAAPAAPDVDSLLGGELDIPTREVGTALPTTEQLGQTIELDEARGPSLELAEQRVEAAAPAAIEELEVTLPGRDVVGGYDDHLPPPPQALEDLEAHRRRLEDDDIPPPPESLAQLPSVQPGAPLAELVPAMATRAEPEAPELVARPIPTSSPETISAVREAFRPSSFSELLDASLALNGN